MKSGTVFLLMLYFFPLSGQSLNNNDQIRKTELQLRQFSDSIMKGSTDQVRQVALAAFNPVFLDLLNNPATFNYPFDSLPAVSKLSSRDKFLRIYTWILPSREKGTYTYYGIIQRINPGTKQFKVIGLQDFFLETADAEVNELKADTWYGAAYYEIIEKKINKKTYYFLLGWKGNDRLTTKKVADVLYFDTWDNITFGAPLFTDEKKKKKHRLVFEYNAQAVMLLRYDKKKKMIVFDHLSPSSPSGKGQYRLYGPDFTYDGLQFKKGVWNYKSNLDLRNPNERK
jgi:hypothetical protein